MDDKPHHLPGITGQPIAGKSHPTLTQEGTWAIAVDRKPTRMMRIPSREWWGLYGMWNREGSATPFSFPEGNSPTV